jgi:7-cyano-7-deazaguanine synthase
MSKVVVVLSGGMDSATLLYRMIHEGHEVSCLSVDYGQRHSRELKAAGRLCADLAVPHKTVNLAGLAAVMKGSSQTDPTVSVPEGHYEEDSMKKTVVPNRNMLLLGVATAHAISLGYDAVAYGAHAGDHAIYPDCRKEFVLALAEAMQICDYKPIRLFAPYLDLDKGDICVEGVRLGVPYKNTWTCYKGKDLACGKCGACQERLEAFAKAERTDPLEYA